LGTLQRNIEEKLGHTLTTAKAKEYINKQALALFLRL
jgi:hypothetical protein